MLRRGVPARPQRSPTLGCLETVRGHGCGRPRAGRWLHQWPTLLCWRVDLLSVHREKSQPASCRPAMVLLIAVISSLEALSMCYPICMSVSVG